jgi:hypothetical protein
VPENALWTVLRHTTRTLESLGQGSELTAAMSVRLASVGLDANALGDGRPAPSELLHRGHGVREWHVEITRSLGR